jgi:hypothetical protein
VRVLSRLFRRLFLRELENAFSAGKLRFFGKLADLAKPQAFTRHLGELCRLDWVVYAKPPFGGPEQVLADLGRYTHRVAIANSRLLSLADGKVRFTWKDYRAGGKTKVMTLDANEFIRRFLLHTLPRGFVQSGFCEVALTASTPGWSAPCDLTEPSRFKNPVFAIRLLRIPIPQPSFGDFFDTIGQRTNPLPRERAARESEGWAGTEEQLRR